MSNSTSLKDALEAVETIQSFFDEFNATFPQRMEPLKGEEINKLSEDKYSIQRAEEWLRTLKFHLDNINSRE